MLASFQHSMYPVLKNNNADLYCKLIWKKNKQLNCLPLMLFLCIPLIPIRASSQKVSFLCKIKSLENKKKCHSINLHSH